MTREPRTFTMEFKPEVVRLTQTNGKSVSQVARDLGIVDSTLFHWCQQLAQQGPEAFPGSGHQTALEEEHRRLKREPGRLQQEYAVLNKRWPSSHEASHDLPVHHRASRNHAGQMDVPRLKTYSETK